MLGAFRVVQIVWYNIHMYLYVFNVNDHFTPDHSATGPSCPPDTVESIMWPRTDGGQTATQPCVCVASQSNLASRPCGSDGQWGEPDLTLCVFSSVVQNLCPTVSAWYFTLAAIQLSWNIYFSL